MRQSKREQLIDTAADLFQRDGFRKTGIDRILAEAGVAKMTLYKHFGSKEELVHAALRRLDQRAREQMLTDVNSLAANPGDRVLAVFDLLASECGDPSFRGCAFLRAAAEFAEPNEPTREVAAEHYRWLEDYFREQTAAAGHESAEGLARQLVLLYAGAVELAHLIGVGDPAQSAQAAARRLVNGLSNGLEKRQTA